MTKSATEPPQPSAAHGPKALDVRSVAGRPLPDAAHAAVDVKRFLVLLLQLGLLLFVFWGLRVESTHFLRLSACCFAGFVIHYFLPFAWKKWGFVAVSLIGAVIIEAHASRWFAPLIYEYFAAIFLVTIAMTLGLIFYGCMRLRLPYWVRVGMVVAVGLVLAHARTGNWLIPSAYWPMLGAIFMFRMIVYVFEVRRSAQPESLSDFFGYFFCLPGFYFPLFPVIDYLTFKKSFYADDIHRTAQRGIAWMVRGTTHLCLYRLIYHRLVIGADEVHSFLTLCHYIFPAYLLYLRVSGHFHIIIGMLHLFGYRLPETNRNYLLADSFIDFWRRINIYWKDFMIKVFYYPVYFRWRKQSVPLALALATMTVFVSSCLLHGYQWFWRHGMFRVSQQDLVFWTVLGVLVLATVFYEEWRGKAKKRSRSRELIVRTVKTLGVYVSISIIWSMWTSPSLHVWWDAVTYWR